MRTTPFFRALIEPRLVLGVDKLVFMMLLMTGCGIAFVFKTLWVFPPVVVLFIALRSVFKFDPLYLAVYLRYSKEGDRYEPHVRALAPHGLRRRGRGKGVLC